MNGYLTPADALDQAAAVIAVNGYCRDYLWDVDQAAAGTRREDCRVDILGALGIAVHGDPRQVASREVRELEALLAARLPAPSVTAWCSYRSTGRREAVRLLRSTAADLRAQVT